MINHKIISSVDSSLKQSSQAIPLTVGSIMTLMHQHPTYNLEVSEEFITKQPSHEYTLTLTKEWCRLIKCDDSEEQRQFINGVANFITSVVLDFHSSAPCATIYKEGAPSPYTLIINGMEICDAIDFNVLFMSIEAEEGSDAELGVAASGTMADQIFVDSLIVARWIISGEQEVVIRRELT